MILGGGPWETTETKRTISSPASFPLLDGFHFRLEVTDRSRSVCRLDPSTHLYLQDHQLDAKPVLPAAMAMELMAEVVQKGWPEWQVVGIRALRVLKGIILEDGRQERSRRGPTANTALPGAPGTRCGR